MRLTHLYCLLYLLPVLAGCQAPLDLSAVGAEQDRAQHRFDEFQAAAFHTTTAVVVGGMGVVLISHDSGRSWQREQIDAQPALIDVTVCPDGVFHALDIHRAVWTRQAGQWVAQALPSEETPQAITCAPDGRLWVSASFSTVLLSADGAKSWQSRSFDEDLMLTTVQFTDAQSGVMTGEFGTVMVTDDAGASWRRAEALPNELYPQAAWFSDRLHGWVVGLNGQVFHTDDGAASWRPQDLGSRESLYGVAPFGAGVVMVGDHDAVFTGDAATLAAFEHAPFSRSYLRAAVALDDKRILVAGGAGTLAVLEID